jgi:hypothetical protein
MTTTGEALYLMSGTVTFSDGATTLGSVSVSNFSAVLTTSALAAGTHSLTASYSGDNNYLPSAGSATQTVQGGGGGTHPTTTTLTSSPNPSTVGQAVTLTAALTQTVSPDTATGTVSFADGATPLGSVPISGGTATLTVSTLAAGSHSLSANYSGDAGYAASTGTTTQVVQAGGKTATTTSLAVSPNPAVPGQTVSLTATVAPAATTGSVTFFDDATSLGSSALTAGTATLAISNFSAGNHSLTARYGGDSTYDVSTSSAVTLAVNALSLTVTPNPAAVGQLVVLTATVTPSTAAGAVSFLDGNTVLGTRNLVNGTAALGTSSLAAGSHSLSATYSGANAAVATLTVNAKTATSTALAVSPNPATTGQTVTLSATVTPSGATGTVRFLIGSATLGTAALVNGSASITTTTLPATNNSLTATYDGDSTYNGSTSGVVTEVVNVAPGGPVPISITSNPTGAGFLVNGANCGAGSYTTPQPLNWPSGGTCSVSFASPQTSSATQYTFEGWQDGSAANPRNITVASQAASYSANFNVQYLLTATANPAAGGTVSGGGFYVPGTTATVTAIPAGGYRLIGWSGASAIAGTMSATVTMNGPQTVIANFAINVAPAPPGTYSVTQIIANASAPQGKPINNVGQVISTNNTGAQRALLWTPTSANAGAGSIMDIGSLPNAAQTVPVSINDQGQVAGVSNLSKVFLWQPAAPNAITGTMWAILDSQTVHGINSYGQIAGSYFLWTPSSANGATGSTNTDSRLGFIVAINDYGQTVNDSGGLFTPSAPHGSTGTFTQIPITAGSLVSYAGLNNNGTVLVNSGIPGAFHGASLWIPNAPNGASGVLTSIPVPQTINYLSGNALNNAGEVVGAMGQTSDSVNVPFLYAGGNVYDLSLLPNWPVGGVPVGINDFGQIVVNVSNGGVYLVTPQALPKWSITKTHTGNFTLGQNGTTYTIAISNAGTADTSGTVTVTENIPNGLTLASMTGSTWTCSANTCTRSNALAPGASYPPISVMVNVAANAAASVTNQATVSGGGAISMTASDPTTIVAPTSAIPSIVSLSPAASTGASQTFTFQFSDTAGWQALTVLNVLINNSLDANRACYLAYAVGSHLLYLVTDSGTGLLPGVQPGGAGFPVSNGQCSITSATATESGNTLTLTVAITFSSSFGGNKVIYLAARDLAGNSGWQTMGVHGVPPLPATFPNPVSMSPALGTTASATLTFTYQDATAASNLQTMWALVNTALDAHSACYFAYNAQVNMVFLVPDNGNGLQAPGMLLSGSGTLTNGQCTISAQGSGAVQTGSQLALTLNILFKPAFAGSKVVWMAAQTLSGATSAWQPLGAWTVPGN